MVVGAPRRGPSPEVPTGSYVLNELHEVTPGLAFKGLTQPLMMAWYVTPDAGLGTGYPGPPLNLAARPE